MSDLSRLHVASAALAIAVAASACSGLFEEETQDARTRTKFGNDGGDPAGSSRVVCDDRVHAAASEGRRITRSEYQRAIADIFEGAVPASEKFPGSYGKSLTGYSTEPAINALGEQDVAQLQLAAEEVALDVADSLAKLLPCAATKGDDACVEQFVDKYARRAYRRALTNDERAQLMATFHDGLASGQGVTFVDAMAMLVDHMLQTPQFLYVMEDAAPTARALTGDEIASRLSFLLWDSIPDDELLAAASSGALADRKNVLAQATRLLSSEKANTAVARFFREWTGTQQLSPVSKDAATFPQFDAAFARSMNESFDRFVLGQMRSQGTVTSLLRSPETFVDDKMAGFYGVPAPAAGEWKKVTLDGARYSGLATQGALLASLAHPTDASFVLRGKFVVTRLLCRSLGDPPPNAQAVLGALPKPPDPTGKDVSASILTQPACAGCHAVMNPPGLAFEHFDGIGQYRSAYASGKAIDTTGTLPATGGDAVSFQGPSDLMEALAKDPRVESCFTTQIFRFAMSRRETEGDACALQALSDALKSANGKMADTLLALTMTDAFTNRVDP